MALCCCVELRERLREYWCKKGRANSLKVSHGRQKDICISKMANRTQGLPNWVQQGGEGVKITRAYLYVYCQFSDGHVWIRTSDVERVSRITGYRTYYHRQQQATEIPVGWSLHSLPVYIDSSIDTTNRQSQFT
jgi:hypothetical protein